MAVTSPRRSERLRSALLDGRSGFSPFLESASATLPKQCGACLLDIDTVSKDGDFVAILESCKSLHFFHVRCISTWAAQENTCPLCKVRFGRFGIYGAGGDLRRVSNVEERDQHEGASDEDDEEVVCSVCQRSDDDEALLLCDGLGGQCSGAAHFYCVGLPGVPQGEWFCPECQELPLDSSLGDSQAAHAKKGYSGVTEAIKSEVKDSKMDDPRLQTEFVQDEKDAKDAKAAKDTAMKGSPSVAKRGLDSPESKVKRTKRTSEVKVEYEASQASEIKKESASSKAQPQNPQVNLASSDASKWIHLNGRFLQIELGGRRIKDAAAVAVAKLVRSVLEKFCARHSSSPLVSLNLAGNRLGKAGLMTLLEAIEHTQSHLVVLNLEWNRIDASAVTWLTSWLSKQPGPPRKLLLSHNRAIGDMAAQHLFQSLGRMCERGNTMPWIEAKYIGIRDVDAFMELLSAHVNFCFALDADACAPDRCASRLEGNNFAEQPQMHLFGILEQRSQAPKEIHDSFDSFDTVADSGSPARSSRLESDSQEYASQNTQQTMNSDSQETFAESQPNLKIKQDTQDRKIKHFSTDPGSTERDARREWAASLGKSGVAVVDDIDKPAPAPSYGMWDLACAEAKKARKLERRRKVQQPVEKKTSESLPQDVSKAELANAGRVSKVILRTLGSFSEKDTDYVALKALVDSRVKRKVELWKALTITESEKRLRQKCLVNELCKQVFEDGFKTATGSAGSWEAYLKTSIGHQNVVQWLDKKLSEATAACKPR